MPVSRFAVLLVAALLLSACAAPATLSPAIQQLATEPAGSLLAVRNGDLWLIQGGKLRQFTTGGSWRQPRWSPDGTRFAYVFRAENFSEIFVMNRDGSNPQRLTDSQSPILQDDDWAFSPAWSPDGQRLAFTSDSNSYNPMLWVMQADGSGKRQLVSANSGLDAVESPAWSPDGKTIAFTGFRNGLSQIYRYELDSKAVSPVTATSQGALDPAWSPDGQWIAYVAREEDRTSVHVIRADGSGDGRVSRAESVRSPVWSPDGHQLAFLASPSGSFELYLVTVDTSAAPAKGTDERQVTTDLNADAASGLSWTSQ